MRYRPLLVILMLAASLGSAQAGVGAYAGASAGRSDIKDDSSSPPLSFDESDTGYKVFGGFRSAFLGIEVGYTDFGSPEGNDGGALDATVRASGWEFVGIGTIPIVKRFEIFGKFGFVAWDTKITINSISDSDHGNDTMWGAGVVLKFSDHLAARLEYENFDVRGLDTVELTSAGLEYRF